MNERLNFEAVIVWQLRTLRREIVWSNFVRLVRVDHVDRRRCSSCHHSLCTTLLSSSIKILSLPFRILPACFDAA